MQLVLLGLSTGLISWNRKMAPNLVDWVAYLELGEFHPSELRRRFLLPVEPAEFGEICGVKMGFTDYCVALQTDWQESWGAICLTGVPYKYGERGFVASLKSAPNLKLPDTVEPPEPVDSEKFMRFGKRVLSEFLSNINEMFFFFQQLQVQGSRAWIPNHREFGGTKEWEPNAVLDIDNRKTEYAKPFSAEMELLKERDRYH